MEIQKSRKFSQPREHPSEECSIDTRGAMFVSKAVSTFTRAASTSFTRASTRLNINQCVGGVASQSWNATRSGTPNLLTTPARYNFQSYPAKKHLNDIMKLELILMEEPDQIKALWFSYHNVKPGLVPSVLTDKEQDLLVKRCVYI